MLFLWWMYGTSQLALSFNQPKFCPNASWNPNAVTFANTSIVGYLPYAIFVNTNNTVFVASYYNHQILIWRNESVNPTKTIFASFSSPYSMFVSSNDEIFIDNGYYYTRVDRWTLNGTQLPSPMFTCTQCYGVFVDVYNNLYCSETDRHQVVRTSLSNPDNTTIIVAGIGCQGSTSITLDHPRGIFVADNLDLYVVDRDNNRIQLFRRGERDATTLAGNTASGTISLSHPTGVVLDGNGYLFIVDCDNHRIVGSGPYGFRCLVGCSGSRSSASDQLWYPQTLGFDTDGNMFVTDWLNSRIQKFLLANNSCSKWNVRCEVLNLTAQHSSGLDENCFGQLRVVVVGRVW